MVSTKYRSTLNMFLSMVSCFLPKGMGWIQPPPLFTAATETVADLANHNLRDKLASSPRQLDDISSTPPPVVPNVPRASAGQAPAHIPPQSSPAGRPSPPVKSWDVYVEDFIGMVQGNCVHMQHVKRVLLQALDSVFRKLETTDNPHRQEPALIKKMLKGDATWSTRKKHPRVGSGHHKNDS
jgi:hypothetical protein